MADDESISRPAKRRPGQKPSIHIKPWKSAGACRRRIAGVTKTTPQRARSLRTRPRVHALRPSADEQAKACSRVLATIGIMEERRIRAAGGAPHISDSPMER